MLEPLDVIEIAWDGPSPVGQAPSMATSLPRSAVPVGCKLKCFPDARCPCVGLIGA